MKFYILGLLACTCACGSNAGKGDISASLISKPLSASTGVWFAIDQDSATDGNTGFVTIMISDIDLCATFTAALQGESAGAAGDGETAGTVDEGSHELLTIALAYPGGGLPPLREYPVTGAVDDPASTGAAGSTMSYFDGVDTDWVAGTGSVKLITVPTSTTSGTLAGTATGTFIADDPNADTIDPNAITFDPNDVTFDPNAATFDPNSLLHADPNGASTPNNEAQPLSAAFSSAYCPAFATLVQQLAGADGSDMAANMPMRAATFHRAILERLQLISHRPGPMR